MYISCQSRNGDIDEFFKHENQAVPLALSDMGGLRSCTKSDLVACLDKTGASTTYETPSCDAKILDGSVRVNMLPPTACSTFGDYAYKVFLPYLKKNLQSVSRLDVVWDRYLDQSLKSTARHKRGSENCIVVQSSTPIPTN